MEIRLLKRTEIDKLKWDSCVHYAHAGNLFGYTWYLDNVVKEWDGLVEGDYVSVFPLIKKKLSNSISALYTPNILPKSGLYSTKIASQQRINNFLNHIPSKYKIRDIVFSTGLKSLEHPHLKIKQDYILNLRDEYTVLFQSYDNEIVEGLSNLDKVETKIDTTIKPEEIAAFLAKNIANFAIADKHSYLRIMYNVIHRGNGFVSGVRDGNGELLAADFFTFSHGKIISLAPVFQNNALGKYALWKIVDLMIQNQAGKPIIFDFNTLMGDINPQLFGAVAVPYACLSENKLKGVKKWWYSNK